MKWTKALPNCISCESHFVDDYICVCIALKILLNSMFDLPSTFNEKDETIFLKKGQVFSLILQSKNDPEEFEAARLDALPHWYSGILISIFVVAFKNANCEYDGLPVQMKWLWSLQCRSISISWSEIGNCIGNCDEETGHSHDSTAISQKKLVRKPYSWAVAKKVKCCTSLAPY